MKRGKLASVLRSARRKSAARAKLTSVGVVVVAIVAAVLAQTSSGERVTRTAGIAAPSEPYTELYFSDPPAISALTEIARPGSTVDHPAFVIESHEHTSFDYRWTASVDGTVRISGTQVLGPGQLDLISPRVPVDCAQATAPDPGSPRQVVVRIALAQPSEAISYLVNCGR